MTKRAFAGPTGLLCLGILASALFVTGLSPTEAALGQLSWSRRALEAGAHWRLVTSLLAHTGPMHLFGNLVALFVVGRIAEARLGTPRFLLLTLGAAIAGALAHVLVRNDPVAGASGAVFGLLAFTIVSAPRERVGVGRLRVPLFACVALYAAALPLSTILSGAPTSHAAHAGGALAGVAAVALLDARRAAFSLPVAGLVLAAGWVHLHLWAGLLTDAFAPATRLGLAGVPLVLFGLASGAVLRWRPPYGPLSARSPQEGEAVAPTDA